MLQSKISFAHSFHLRAENVCPLRTVLVLHLRACFLHLFLGQLVAIYYIKVYDK